MTDSALKSTSQDSGVQQIVVDEVFHHAPETIWRALTDGALMARWMMQPTGFEARVGNRFTFQTTAAGGWDGIIRCEILEVVPNQRLVYAWRGGHAANVGYGSLLDTTVTFALTSVGVGTRLKVVHAGFDLPRNETAYTSMSNGWKKVVHNLGTIAGQQD
ncbi:MAG: SRPBCC domain-containing protein [Rhodospirillaceae bacterium]|nr:SRPBCC domain-containing protein [Rhodospirillaceae bacterium]